MSAGPEPVVPPSTSSVSGTADGLERMIGERVRRPILAGSIVVGALVAGLGVWAAVTPLASGISAPAQVRVESNRKTLRHREAGTVRAILVREGDRVRAGQPLLIFDDVAPKAQLAVLQSAYDSESAQMARFAAEAAGRTTLEFPPELSSRMSDPKVSAVVRDQQLLFASRFQLYNSQVAVLSQQIDQLQTRVEGLQVQVDSVDEQVRLTREELDGYRELNAKGFAPKTLVLRNERALAELEGRRGGLVSDITRTREQMGEIRLRLSALRSERQTQAAEGVRDSQGRLAELGPKLTAARQTLDETVVRAPVEGYVFNLTQFTVGGVAGAGELLMDVVPDREPLVVTARIRPQDVDDISLGMPARVQLVGLNQRFASPVPAKVVRISADQKVDEKTGQGFFVADLAMTAADLHKAGARVRLTPGMPAQALIVTGERTVLGYLVSPIREIMADAFREP